MDQQMISLLGATKVFSPKIILPMMLGFSLTVEMPAIIISLELRILLHTRLIFLILFQEQT